MIETVDEWLEKFETLVRARDFAAGEQLFSPDVFSYGTVANEVRGRENLRILQWEKVWTTTELFQFDKEKSVVYSEDRTMAVAGVQWTSRFSSDSPDRDRAGRATLVLEFHDTGWIAVHSHFSLSPR